MSTRWASPTPQPSPTAGSWECAGVLYQLASTPSDLMSGIRQNRPEIIVVDVDTVAPTARISSPMSATCGYRSGSVADRNLAPGRSFRWARGAMLGR